MFNVIKPFVFYNDGVTPTHYGEGFQSLPERAAEVAVAEGWAEPVVEVETQEAESLPERAAEVAAPKRGGRK